MDQSEGQRSKTNEKIEELKEFITETVNPINRSNIKFNLSHQTQLAGDTNKLNKKKKKPLKPKRKTKKSLTRKSAAELGLFTLPTKSLKYQDILPLHELWTDYMKQHLQLINNGDGDDDDGPPEIGQPGYDAFAKLLVKSDLHGAIIKVTRSRCPSVVGVEGIIAMDTKNTFKIVSKDNRLRTIPKQDSVFQFWLNGHLKFTIFGKHLRIRPAERSVKKIKNYMDLDL